MRFTFSSIKLYIVYSIFIIVYSKQSFRHNKMKSSVLSNINKSSVILNAAVTIDSIDNDKSINNVQKQNINDSKATISTSVFNLAKSIIGAGVLSLPGGIAYFSSDVYALIPASLITITMGLISAYSFSTIGKACEQHSVTTFQDVWSKSVNDNSGWIISLLITSKCLFGALAYSIIIGDSFTALAATTSLPPYLITRTNIIIAISTFVLLPLCSLKSLTALAPFSLLGLGGTLYAALFMAIRLFDGSYLPNGQFYQSIINKPKFSTGTVLSLNPKIFVLLSMLSTAFLSHFNAPRFYKELKQPTSKRFNQVTFWSFSIAITTYLFMMSIGYLTFGGSSLGFVLNNYATNDPLATIARVSTGLTLLTGYPFTFTALRDGILDLLKVENNKKQELFSITTVILLSIVTLSALIMKDVGFVLSISGALFSCALMFIIPGIMEVSNIKKRVESRRNNFGIVVNYGLIGIGIVMAALGVIVNILKQIKLL